jgi:hypothetical protein
MMQPLKNKAANLGIQLLDKTQVVELLKQDGRVTGAAGFNLLDGRFTVLNAKATILANGDCDFGVMRMWANACGDGIAAAYNAGAEMRNAEFGNFYDVVNKGTGIPIVFSFNVSNAQGENITAKYIQGPQPDIPISLSSASKKGHGRKGPSISAWLNSPSHPREAQEYFNGTGPISKRFSAVSSPKYSSTGRRRQKRLKSPSGLPVSFHPSKSTVK